MELVHLEIDTSSPFPNHDFDSFDHAATEEAKLNCTDSLDDLFLHDFKYCTTHWDRISCWPLTRANQFAIISCFAELSDVQYDTTQNATRFCFPNGTWAKSDYSRCTPILSNETESEFAKPEVLYTMHLINYFGYSISIIALLTALIIFAYFKDLHCIRNTIHANFMISHLFVGVTWIVTALVQRDESEVFRLECLLYIILIYFNVTTFFWMFIEGLYLYILVLKTFSIERVKKHTYLFIGWGLPVILVSVWTPLKYYFPHVLYIFTSPQKTKSNCPWSNNEAIVDHVFIVLPILFILLANIFFLGMVIYVLVTQLCISTAAEFQQYRKAAKALLVLTPLLGITYALILVAPESTPGVLVGYLHSILFSTQGLTVAVLYCFLNSEVRNSLRYHVTRWKAVRMLKTGHYPIPVPYSLKMRPRQTMRCNRLRYTFSANGNSCIVTGGSNDTKNSFQESVSHFPAVIRYSSKSTKSTSLSEDFV